MYTTKKWIENSGITFDSYSMPPSACECCDMRDSLIMQSRLCVVGLIALRLILVTCVSVTASKCGKDSGKDSGKWYEAR